MLILLSVRVISRSIFFFLPYTYLFVAMVVLALVIWFGFKKHRLFSTGTHLLIMKYIIILNHEKIRIPISNFFGSGREPYLPPASLTRVVSGIAYDPLSAASEVV